MLILFLNYLLIYFCYVLRCSKASLRWEQRPKIAPRQHPRWRWLGQHHPRWGWVGQCHSYWHKCFENSMVTYTAEEDFTAGKVQQSDIPASHHSQSSLPVSADHNIAHFPHRPAWGAVLNAPRSSTGSLLRDIAGETARTGESLTYTHRWALHGHGPGPAAELVSS